LILYRIRNVAIIIAISTEIFGYFFPEFFTLEFRNHILNKVKIHAT